MIVVDNFSGVTLLIEGTVSSQQQLQHQSFALATVIYFIHCVLMYQVLHTCTYSCNKNLYTCTCASAVDK